MIPGIHAIIISTDDAIALEKMVSRLWEIEGNERSTNQWRVYQRLKDAIRAIERTFHPEEHSHE